MLDSPDQPKNFSLSDIQVGSKKLLRLNYILKASGTMTVTAGDYEVTVETLQLSQFAFYVYDIVPTSSSPVDVYITAGVMSNALAGGGIQCCLIKRRIGVNPDRVRVVLHISCTLGGPYTISYEVYRLAGLN